MRLGLMIGLLLATASLVTPAAAQNAGRQLVEQHCAMCHAINRSGTSPNRLAPPLRRVGEFYDLDQLAELLASGRLFAPHPQMPLFKFDYRSARAITNYIRSIQQ